MIRERYHCMIVEDEPIAHSILINYLTAFPDFIITAQAYNTIDATNLLDQHKIDLLFLDIQMPEETGLDFLKKLDNKPITIFTTAFPQHAVEAYDLGVLDYLVKPIREERFRLTMNRAKEFLDLQYENQLIQKSKNHILSIQSGKSIYKVQADDIIYIQALKDYMMIFTHIKKYVIRITMRQLISYLPGNQFIRVLKSFIINNKKIIKIGITHVELGTATIPIGDKFRNLIR